MTTTVVVMGQEQFVPGCDPNRQYESCEAAISDGKVCVTVSTESLDPCSPQWIFDFINNVLPAVGDIIVVRRYHDGTALNPGQSCLFEAPPPSFPVCTFHGPLERRVNIYEACVQYYAAEAGIGADDGHRASLEYTYCTNGQCTGPGTGLFGLEFCEFTGSLLTTEGLVRAKNCVQEISGGVLNWQEISECANGVLGQSLHWESSRYLNDIGLIFGSTGLPPVLVNGKAFSQFWDCNSHVTQLQPLIQTICEQYNGTAANLPEACQQYLLVEEEGTGGGTDAAETTLPLLSQFKNIITRFATFRGGGL